jgi:hypothetical protein
VTTAVFTVVYRVLLRPLPYRDRPFDHVPDPVAPRRVCTISRVKGIPSMDRVRTSHGPPECRKVLQASLDSKAAEREGDRDPPGLMSVERLYSPAFAPMGVDRPPRPQQVSWQRLPRVASGKGHAGNKVAGESLVIRSGDRAAMVH